MRITLPYPPQANHLYTIARGRKVLSTKGRAYKAGVEKTCLIARIKPQTGNLKVSVWIYRPRKIGDIDNALKSVLDSVKGYAWNDDSQIIELHAYRSDDKNYPRVDMMVQEI